MITYLTGVLLSTLVAYEPPRVQDIESWIFVLNKQVQVQNYMIKKRWTRVSYWWFSFQCVDLAKDWYTYITWRPAPHFSWSARMAWHRWLRGMKRTNTPTPWDLVFMDFYNNWHSPGHVGVFLYMDGDYAVFLDQNWWWWGGSGKWADSIRVNSAHKSLLLGYLTFEEAWDKSRLMRLVRND